MLRNEWPCLHGARCVNKIVNVVCGRVRVLAHATVTHARDRDRGRSCGVSVRVLRMRVDLIGK